MDYAIILGGSTVENEFRDAADFADLIHPVMMYVEIVFGKLAALSPTNRARLRTKE
jgi:hypothetical protein